MYPELLNWGFIHVRTYGLMLAIAFLVGTGLGLKEARRHGLDEDRLMTVILVTLIASVLGARMLYVVEHVHEFRQQWASALALWEGGLTLYGGIVAGTLAGLMTARALGMPMWTVADSLAPSLALGTVFGRVGCFLNGCCYGRPTNLPWGIVYPPDSYAGLEFGAAPIHPAQLYAAGTGLILFVVLWGIRKRVRTPGVLFWTFIMIFTLVRAGLDLTRAYEPEAVITRFGGFDVTESQLVSLAMTFFAMLMILRLRRSGPAPASAPATVP